jgi:hypothetical protein
MGTKGRPWTPEEDAVVMATEKPREAAEKLGRTYYAVNQRRYMLRHPARYSLWSAVSVSSLTWPSQIGCRNIRPRP